VADSGKDGHFGLQGMRERAARIGGTITLLSSLASGTEIKLVVPGRIIFRSSSRVRPVGLARMKTLLRLKDHESTVD
jgi:signal transduction histidine kinase